MTKLQLKLFKNSIYEAEQSNPQDFITFKNSLNEIFQK